MRDGFSSKSYNTQTDSRFDMKTFTELRNAQSIIVDGWQSSQRSLCAFEEAPPSEF